MSTYDYAVLEVIRVVDGDTIDARIDLGFHMSAALRFRVRGLRAREDNAGLPEKRLVQAWRDLNAQHIRVTTYKPVSEVTITPDGSFGRWLAEVYAADTGERLADYVITAMDRVGIDCRWKG